MEKRTNSANMLLPFVFLMVGFFGGLALATSYMLPFERVKTYLDAQAHSGAADGFTGIVYDAIMFRMRMMGGLLLLLGGIGWAFEKSIQPWIGQFLSPHAISFRMTISRGLQTLTHEKLYWYTFVVFTVWGALLRLLFLFQPMRFDESYTFWRFASRSLPVILADYRFPNNHILHTLLVYVSTHLFGNHPWAIRLPAFLAGVLLIPAGYLLAAILYDHRTALLSAGFMATSAQLIDYSTNARGYTILCLIVLLLLLLAAYLSHTHNLGAWIVFVVLSALGFYTIPIMLYPFGMILTWLFLSQSRSPSPYTSRQAVKTWLLVVMAVGFLTLALYAPILIASGIAALRMNEVKPHSWHEFVKYFPLHLQSTWSIWHSEFPSLASLLYGVSCVIACLFHRRLSRYRAPVLLAALLWCLPVVIMQRVIPFERVWLFLLPIYWISVSAGIIYGIAQAGGRYLRLTSKRVTVGVILGVVVLSLHILSTQAPAKDNKLGYVENIAAYLNDHLKPGDRVITMFPAETVLLYYFQRYHLSTQYLTTELHDGQRLFIIVHKGLQTLKTAISTANLAHIVRPEAATLLQDYQDGSLYEYAVVR